VTTATKLLEQAYRTDTHKAEGVIIIPGHLITQRHWLNPYIKVAWLRTMQIYEIRTYIDVLIRGTWADVSPILEQLLEGAAPEEVVR